MAKKITVAVIGCGDFACNFVPLFQAHPYVETVYVCDIIPERAREYSQRFGVEIIDTFENAIADSKITAVAIFTQRHLHGPLVKAALKAGKDVYSAVPMGVSVEECREIVETVKKTGKTYMMGETCIYYPCSMYCKQRYEKGDFGTFVYAEAQYHHDISHFPKNFREDLVNAGVPPFYYPTHSTAMVLHALSTRATRVVAFGYAEAPGNGIYEKGVNQWDNVYSNGYSLMKLANGGTARINECRRIGYKAPSSYISAFYGTKGSYQFSNAQHIFARLQHCLQTLRGLAHIDGVGRRHFPGCQAGIELFRRHFPVIRIVPVGLIPHDKRQRCHLEFQLLHQVCRQVTGRIGNDDIISHSRSLP